MQLIGMLDSPYVRRTAICLDCLGLSFEHKSISVFSTFEQFKQINPVVKAPSFVCDDGTVLMDSTLIIDYAEALAGKSLLPAAVDARKNALRVLGLALAGCEKAVQIVYERNVRPVEKQHQPWLERVRAQMLSAYAALETEVTKQSVLADQNSQAFITTAVVWYFTKALVPDCLNVSDYPSLNALSKNAEQLAAFKKYPHEGPGVDTGSA